jgi:mRNA-degrading endonuclease RelE of RelBE toxin-antitoxin system
MTKISKINYNETQEFKKDFKWLLKKYKSLKKDFELVKKSTIDIYHLLKINNHSIVKYEGKGFCGCKFQIFKIKKFACRYLKGRGNNSGFRVVYAFYPDTLIVEFLEIYFKADKVNANENRIKSYIKKVSKSELMIRKK